MRKGNFKQDTKSIMTENCHKGKDNDKLKQTKIKHFSSTKDTIRVKKGGRVGENICNV